MFEREGLPSWGVAPFVHYLFTSVRAPALALSRRDGDIDAGSCGVFVGDRRIVSRCTVTFDGARLVALAAESGPGGRARFVGTPPTLDDPAFLVERVRDLQADGAVETITLTSHGRAPLDVHLEVDIGCDLASIAQVRDDAAPAELESMPTDDGVGWSHPDGTTVTLSVTGAELSGSRASCRFRLGPDESAQFVLHWRTTAAAVAGFVAAARPSTTAPTVETDDPHFGALVRQSVADLADLELAEGSDRFYAAGAPWYLTLFGRDSLWSAELTLPLGTELAAGTLNVLGRRQGRRHDEAAAEEPGKILHELRAQATEISGVRLPATYYGTVDATPLWISLLHRAWRWGLADDAVAALLPNLERALGWVGEQAGDGFLRYVDATGQGLANQGWKDSADAVQFADATLAAAPLALCEVQGYAYAAAVRGADLLDAFDRPGGAGWRDWAAALAERFRARFWVTDEIGLFPAIALDADGRPADTPTSNMGHLLGTGLLDEAESAAVVWRLAAPDLDSGHGLRTMSANARGFNPLGYHTGSVWPHDNAIVLAGLRHVGTDEADALAYRLVRGLLGGGTAFDYRFPELYGGAGDPPLPYPASCRPQAWSAATAVEMLRAVLGIEPDVPNGTLRITPLAPSPVGALAVRDLPLADGYLDVEITAAGAVSVPRSPNGLAVFFS
jgi:glycogen debranching enzyme